MRRYYLDEFCLSAESEEEIINATAKHLADILEENKGCDVADSFIKAACIERVLGQISSKNAFAPVAVAVEYAYVDALLSKSTTMERLVRHRINVSVCHSLGLI